MRISCGWMVVALAGCTPPDDGMAIPDAPDVPVLAYEVFPPTTLSLAMGVNVAQLSITDATGPDACALATDQQRGLATGGSQIIMQLPAAAAGPCPVGGYSIATSGCPQVLEGTYVPMGCAYFRRWDAQGASLGLAVARNGEITINGSSASCAVRVNVGFLGGSIREDFTLVNGDAANPWCTE